MKIPRKTNPKPSSNSRNESLPSPHRTIDESPAGDPDSSRRIGLRDPLRAPGQIRKDRARRNPYPKSDEIYGGTEIPASREHESSGDLEKKPRTGPPDPRKQPERKLRRNAAA